MPVVVEVTIAAGAVAAASYVFWRLAPESPKLDCKKFLRETLIESISDHYRRVGDLGEGASSDVWLAQQVVGLIGSFSGVSGRLVAVKRVRKPNLAGGLDEEGADSDEAVASLRLEVELMKTVDHPNICRLFEVLEDAKSLFLIMEHIEGGELFDAIATRGALTEADAAQVVREVALALSYCHGVGVVHRDIKPENIMIVNSSWGSPTGETDGETQDIQVKLIDFGFSCRILGNVKLKARVGTVAYSAPEVIGGEQCDEKQDLWALGCVLYVMLSGRTPFDCDRDRIVKGRYSFVGSAGDSISEEAKALVSDLLVVDSVRRISAADVLSHPWLAKLKDTDWLSSSAAFEHVHALEAFHRTSTCQHLCAVALARQLDETSLHELHRTFCAIDENGDGVISLAELVKSCNKLNLTGSELSDFAQIFSSADLDCSGSIEYTEFIAACLNRKVEHQESACWAAFQVFDADGNGYIDHAEFRMLLDSVSMQDSFKRDQMAEVWKEFTGEDFQEVSSFESTGATMIDFDRFLATVRRVCGIPVPTYQSLSQFQPPARHASTTYPSSETPPNPSTPSDSLSLPIWGRTSPTSLLPPIRKQAEKITSTSSPSSDRPTSPFLPIAGRGGNRELVF